MSSVEATIEHWRERLAAYRGRLEDEPQFNPVWQLACDISRALEAEQHACRDLREASKRLSDRALLRRAEGCRDRIGPNDDAGHERRLREHVWCSAFRDGAKIAFAAFAGHWQRPLHAVVFTAHPTFAMSEQLRDVLIGLATAQGDNETKALTKELASVRHAPDEELSLADEHRQAQRAIAHGQSAVARVGRIVLDVARELYPDEWSGLRPNPVELASWVGYDLDGRTDISWLDSLCYRLDEKAQQLGRHAEAILKVRERAPDACRAPLQQAERLLRADLAKTERDLAAFRAAAGNPDSLSRAANDLVAHSAGRPGAALAAVLDLLGKALVDAPDDTARAELVQLLAQVANFGAGTAKIHTRINATQLHNAIRKPLGMEAGADTASRVLLARLDEMTSEVRPETVNFASLAVETATAVRQFILCAQILKHVDGDVPIRLLIAECEQPFTVLAAVYFARLFGVDDRVDISPLFETPFALERGARVIESLLKTDSYRALIKKRGRLCVEAGFSDLGRFMGQVPAALAIERLQGQLAEVVRSAGLDGVEVRIFDTHGESMGRGAHPGGPRDRFAYLLSPWIRARYRSRGLTLVHETSFQGGDGYVYFGSPELAFATVAAQVLSAETDDKDAKDDSFYADFDFSRDLFDRVRTYQQQLFHNEHYSAALGAMGTNLLPRSGSRKSERQYDSGRDSRAVLAEMRAIPHNALLQQFGFLLNVVSGIGAAIWHERERFAEIYQSSDRTRRLMDLVFHARSRSSIKTLVAYANLFDDAYWVTRPYNDLEAHIKEPCLFLSDLLRGDRRHSAMMHLASFLRKDSVQLNDVFREIGLGDEAEEDEGRTELDILHAIRLALIQHIYLLAARVPPFSPRNDVTQAEIMELVLSLRVKEAVALLRETYPAARPKTSDYRMAEPASYGGEDRSDYGAIIHRLVEPMVEAYEAALESSVGISHHYGAHG